jgi:hypothetical protein
MLPAMVITFWISIRYEKRYPTMIRVRFRPARPAPTSGSYLLKTLVQAAFFWTTFLLDRSVGCSTCRRHDRYSCTISLSKAKGMIAWGGFGLASCLGVWSGVTMAVVGKGTPFPSDTARRTRSHRALSIRAQSHGGCWACPRSLCWNRLGSSVRLIYVLAGMMLVEHDCPSSRRGRLVGAVR